MQTRYIAIEGNIGAGKTSLAQMLSEDFNALLVTEQFENNSFLPLFYKEPERYAFPLEMSFLAARYQQLKKNLSTPGLFQSAIISDYFFDKSMIFARKTLQNDEFRLYSRLFNIISSNLPRPDILVYLYSNIDKLQANIKKRGRDYEQEIEDQYLEKIQQSYFDYINTQSELTVVIINNNTLDFVQNSSDYQKIKNTILSSHDKGIHRYNNL